MARCCKIPIIFPCKNLVIKKLIYSDHVLAIVRKVIDLHITVVKNEFIYNLALPLFQCYWVFLHLNGFIHKTFMYQ